MGVRFRKFRKQQTGEFLFMLKNVEREGWGAKIGDFQDINRVMNNYNYT